MVLKTLVVGPLEVNCYLIGDSGTGAIGVVDPGGDADLILEAIRKLNRPVSCIINTHGHFDHVGAVTDLMQALNTEYLIHKNEGEILKGMHEQLEQFGFPGAPPPVPTRYVSDEESVMLGNLEIQILHTPGHSPGGICLYSRSSRQLVSGDTLFRESIGRTDLPRGDTGTLLASIAEKLLVLPEDTKVFPGHGPASTIEYELRNNPFL